MKLIPDLLKQRPKNESLLDTVIIVDGCPVVDSLKSDLLKNVLLKKFSVFGEITYNEMPRDAKQHSKGYIFIGYKNPDSATKAVESMNHFALDKSHTLLVSLLSDFEQSVSTSKEWIPQERKAYTETGNLRSWLLDQFCRNQFALLEKEGEECSIHWHTTSETILIEQRPDWSEGAIHWSSHGTYLATMHSLGVALWGGEDFKRIARFSHKDVRALDFSPQERFLVTLSPATNVETNQQSSPMVDMIIWDVCKVLPCRKFTGAFDVWPIFKWAHDDSYVATLQDGKIYIYDTETFKLLDKKPLNVNVDICDFAWSPSDKIIAYWVAETANTPARVALVSIPTRREICTKNLFSVAEISLIWHPQGDFLAVQVLRCNKKKVDSDKQVKYMGTFVNFEIVRMREKLYPVDQLSVKDSVSCFQWEPNGNRFAYVTSSSMGVMSIAIYELTKNGKVRQISVLSRDNSRINELKWSPKGNVFVVANLKSADVTIEFIDANDSQTLSRCDNIVASELHWDPSGRFLASVVSSFSQKTDNSVRFWNSVGRLLHEKSVNGLRIFAWRPCPPTMLSAEQIQSLKKSLASKYSTQFENEDKMLASKVSRELMERRQAMLSEFEKWRMCLRTRFDTDKPKRILLRGADADNLDTTKDAEEELEFLVNTSREVVRRAA